MLFGLIPLAAISISGIQIAEIFVVVAFLYELSLIRSLRLFILLLSIIFVGLSLGGFTLSAFSQVLKVVLIPLLAFRFSKLNFLDFKFRFAADKDVSNANIFVIFLLLTSSIFNLRLSSDFYIDVNSGLFRHSVDFAFFILCAYFVLLNKHKIIILVFLVLAFISILLGGSRTILLLLPLYFLITRPISGLVSIAFGYILLVNFGSSLISLLPDKIGSIIFHVVSLDIREIIQDSSLEVRFRNFESLFIKMDWLDWLVGLPRESVLDITSSVSFGDVSTDNIVLYKMIFFGIPFGLCIILFFFFSILYLSGSILFVSILFIYGMIQDWSSNGFCIFVLYLTFLAVRNSHKPFGGCRDIGVSN